MDPGIFIAFTICFIVYVVFTSLRRYLIAKTKANLQEKVLQRIDSSEALAVLFRAERRRRRAAIARAERPLLIMQTLGSLAALVTAAWLLDRFTPHTLPTLTPALIAAAIACTLLILAGCAAMLHASRRTSI